MSWETCVLYDENNYATGSRFTVIPDKPNVD